MTSKKRCRGTNEKTSTTKQTKTKNLLVSGLRGHPPVQESHLVSDRKDKRITEVMIHINTEEWTLKHILGMNSFPRKRQRLFGQFAASYHV